MPHVIPTIHPSYVLRTGKPVTDVIAQDLCKAWRVAHEGPNLRENIIYVIPGYPHGLDLAFTRALQWMNHWATVGGVVAVDVETSGLEYFNCRLYSIALGDADNEVAVAFTLRDLHTLPPQYEHALNEALIHVLASPLVTKVYHNSPFDKAVLYAKGYQVNGQTLDTQAMAHLIQPDSQKDLGWVAHTHLDVTPWKLDHGNQKMANTKNPVELLIYNGKDALYTAMLVPPMMRVMYNRGLSSQLVSWQMAFADLATDMEIYGLPVNMEKRRAMALAKREVMGRLLHRMREYLRWPDFNPMSDDHKREALFGPKYAQAPWQLGLTPTKTTKKTGAPSTSYKAIIDSLEHPFVKDLADYIETRSTYAIQFRDGTLPSLSQNKKGKTCIEGPGSYQKAMCADGRLHPKWNPTGQTGSRFSSSPNCFDAETEVLTKEGWVKFPEAVQRVKEVPFAQYNPNSEIITFTKNVQCVEHHTEKRMLSLLSQQLDVRAVEDHRMLLREYNPNLHSKEVTVVPLGQLPQHKRFVHAGQYAFGRVSIGVDFVRLLVACQADGSWAKGGMNFDFKHERKYRRLRALLDAAGAKYSFKEQPERSKHRYHVYIFVSRLTKVIMQWLGSERKWGKWLLDLPKEEAAAFLDEIPRWDGRIIGKRSLYYSLIETNVSWVQTLAMLQGHRTTVCWAGTCWRASISNGKTYSSARVKPIDTTSTENHNEKVYCVTVPTGFILVRRNGKAIIIGNCQNQPANDRPFFEAGPGRVIVGADKDQLELRIMACIAGVAELLEEMNRPGGDPHVLAARNIYNEEFNTAPPKKQKTLRNITKNVVYASIYLAGIETVWRTIRERKQLASNIRAIMTLGVVRKVHAGFFGRYVEIPRYHERNMHLIKQQGFMEVGPLKRRRYYPVQPPPITEVANYSCQPVGSDIVAMEMVQIQDELKRRFRGDASVINHGHDAIYVECAEKNAEEVAQLVNKIFGSTPLDGPAGQVYLTAEAIIAKNFKTAAGYPE